jgi:hypothetical protein
LHTVRRFLAIGMLVLHLGLFTEFDEVFRLPILVEHFIEHREKVPEISFLQFLAMHYKTDVAHDATDMELPFKDCSNSVAIPSFALPEQKVCLSAEIPAHTQVHFSTYISFVSSSALDEIFQPPRA